MEKNKKEVVFDKKYYNSIMREFGYNPLYFQKINFSLGTLSKEDLQRMWLCHHNGMIFSKNISRKSIVTTGFGLSGPPHIGTLSQILRSIALQKIGIPVNIVLGVFEREYLNKIILRNLFFKEACLIGSNSYNGIKDFKEALKIIEKNQSCFKNLISYRLKLKDFQKSLKLTENNNVAKIIFNP